MSLLDRSQCDGVATVKIGISTSLTRISPFDNRIDGLGAMLLTGSVLRPLVAVHQGDTVDF